MAEISNGIIVKRTKSVPFCKNLFNAAYKIMPINNAMQSAIKVNLVLLMNSNITTKTAK